MGKLRVGNAPCSWGTLEFEEAKGEQIAFDRMLDELVETGYTGTELGDWGYMPTDPAALNAELKKRNLVMLGAFVPVAMKHRACHDAGSRQRRENSPPPSRGWDRPKALSRAGRQQRHRFNPHQKRRTRHARNEPDRRRMENFLRRREQDRARSPERYWPQNCVPSPLRRLRRDTRTKSRPCSTPRTPTSSAWSSTPATTPTAQTITTS